MASTVFSPEAERDLIGIAAFIARDKPEAARRWVQHIRSTCDQLSSQPTIGEVRAEFGITDCRSCSVGQYVIFFRPHEHGIEIARVVHGRRDLRNL